MLWGYMSLFGLFLWIGSLGPFRQLSLKNNGYRFLGIAGTMICLFIISFSEYWEDLSDHGPSGLRGLTGSRDFAIFALLLISGISLAGAQLYRNTEFRFEILKWVFLICVPLYFMGLGWVALPQILVNALILLIGILSIRKGTQEDHLGILNFGLITLSVLIMCRFFDSEFSFLLKGVIFILLGLGFFFVNYLMLQKRRKDDS